MWLNQNGWIYWAQNVVGLEFKRLTKQIVFMQKCNNYNYGMEMR